jgi:hypothetical protein
MRIGERAAGVGDRAFVQTETVGSVSASSGARPDSTMAE